MYYIHSPTCIPAVYEMPQAKSLLTKRKKGGHRSTAKLQSVQNTANDDNLHEDTHHLSQEPMATESTLGLSDDPVASSTASFQKDVHSMSKILHCYSQRSIDLMQSLSI